MRRLTPKGATGGSGKQLSISNFFSPKQPGTPGTSKVVDQTTTPVKNGNSESEGYHTPPLKRTRLDDTFEKSERDNGTLKEEDKTPLTPEMREKINEKAVGARLLRASNVMKLLDPAMGRTWFSALEGEFKKDYFKKLNDFVVSVRNNGTTVYPPPENVWEWTKQFPIQDVKVVILGQDPYHGPQQAHGLCFSVRKGVVTPPSLKNMYQELATDIPGFVDPNHGCLTGWAQQGVLLLNAVLTVERSKANSHADKGWENVTDAVIRWISMNQKSVVFFLWGSYAKKKGAVVDKKKHLVLDAAHPSPLSAYKGFYGCKHFSKCNEYLQKNGKTPIDWTRLP